MAVLCLLGLALVPAGLPAPIHDPDLGGSFMEATLARLNEWPATLGFLLLFQGPLAFGAFAMGLAAGKTQFLAPRSSGRPLLRRAAGRPGDCPSGEQTAGIFKSDVHSKMRQSVGGGRRSSM
ncbi:hypothetical protein [Stappia indica]|uniref:hypothetical protein n=1 Tax=Stappia indica TaxID=538381 RepID=UPI001303B5B1|nr:hypothetical protein [Stappia indica]